MLFGITKVVTACVENSEKSCSREVFPYVCAHRFIVDLQSDPLATSKTLLVSFSSFNTLDLQTHDLQLVRYLNNDYTYVFFHTLRAEYELHATCCICEHMLFRSTQ